MQPSGPLHLGNYHGALKNWIALQEEYDCYYFIADWHALTTLYEQPHLIGAYSMDVAIELADELSFNLAWQAGDVALIDNYLVMHGRRPFKGERRVLASLVADDGTRFAA